MATIAAAPYVRLRLSSRPENVLIVRQALRGLSEALGLDEIELNDISTAVTEACNNVVSHAYGELEGGVLEVQIDASRDQLEVLVRDHGVGIGEAAFQPRDEEAAGGIGLPVMRALAQRVGFDVTPGGGTEVRMSFASDKVDALGPPLDGECFEITPSLEGPPQEEMSIAVGPASLARPVLGRVLSALAARARFSSERLGEIQQLAEELVAHLVGSSQRNRLTAGVSILPRNLDLIVGPLREGSSVDGLAPLLERLAASHEVQRSESAEVLAVRLVERSASRS